MARIIGLGELLVDAHYRPDGSTYSYVGSRGGGSVWNTLVNSAQSDADCLAVALYADDWRSQLAKMDLQQLGVDVEDRHSRGSLPTPVMHHMPIVGQATKTRNRFRTSSNCPVCVTRTSTIDIDRSAPSFPVRDIIGAARGDIFVVDGLSKLRVEWAAALKSRGWLTVADIGYSRFLRYMRREEIREKLGAFSLLVMQRSSAEFLASRLELSSVDDVSELLEVRLVVSDGGNGLVAYDETGQMREPIDPPSVDVVDSVGAGDALLGGLLARLSRARSASKLPFERFLDALRESVSAATAVLFVEGARGHLLEPVPELSSIGPSSENTLSQLREMAAGGRCVVCGNESNRSVSRIRPQSSTNSTNLLARVVAAASSTKSIRACREMLDDPKPTVVCASGGSFPAARIIADSLNNAGSFAVAMKPLDVLMTMPSASRVVGISYSGRSSDTVEAISALGQKYGAMSAIITRVPSDAVRQLPGDVQVIAYGLTAAGTRRSAERGFVAMAAAVSPVALWAAAVTESSNVADLLRDSNLPDLAASAASRLVEHCAMRDRSLGIIGSGWATGSILDLESKITEAGLGHVLVHEAKDFSHGRFMSVVGTRAITGGILHVSVGSLGIYEKQLLDVLGKTVDIESVASEESGILGALETLYAAQRFATYYGREQGVDIARPGDPPDEFVSLYRWNAGLGGEGSLVLD